jgi:hypothetical protein
MTPKVMVQGQAFKPPYVCMYITSDIIVLYLQIIFMPLDSIFDLSFHKF